MPNEAFARVKIDKALEAVGWDFMHGQSVIFENRLTATAMQEQAA